MVKNQIIKSSFREIKSSLPRFLSLLMMSLLGVFTFVGLKETTPFMMDSLDKYLDSQNSYDIILTSTVGFDDEAISILKNNSLIEDVEGGKYQDVVVLGKENQEYTIRVHANQTIINNISQEISDNEVYVEEYFLEKAEYEIGDTIYLNSENLVYQEFVIAGTIDSSLYYENVKLMGKHGNTNIGSGTLNFYCFVSPDAFSYDYYTNIYVTVKNAIKEQTNSKKYNSLINDVLDSIDQEELIVSRVNSLESDKEEIEELISQYEEYGDTVEQYDSNKATALEAVNSLGFSDFASFIAFYNTLPSPTSELTVLYNTIIMIEASSAQIEELREALAEQQTSYLEAIDGLNDFTKVINNAKAYKNDRSENKTYNDYINDSKSIDNLAKLFPVVFYAVAILVSLVSMNRMVEDDRVLIGTFKSLGFNNRHIITKYMIFSLMATIIGGVIGTILGIFIIPTMINNIYKLLFDLPKFYYRLELSITILGISIAIVCICGVTLLTVLKSLKEKPSELLRPKAPKSGKNIFFENMKFWNNIKFSRKVTIRNIFRYKKRVIITILSVSGCLALMLCGFGVRDAISDIPYIQFGTIIEEDATVVLNNLDREEAINALDVNEVTDSTLLMSINGLSDGYNISINVVDSDHNRFIHFKDLDTDEEVSLKDNEVIISDKLAELINKKKGDEITFTDINMNSYTYKITCVCEFYINHTIFITEETYRQTGNEYYINMAYVNLIELDEAQKENLQKRLLEDGNILNLSYIEDIINDANDMLKTLNKVVVILIVLSMMLSFVVLYNLSNINIQERKREIATLKVLGFYPKEVDKYITSENIILTLFGAILGVVFGYFFTYLVTSTVEIEYVRFIHQIKIYSYIYSIALSFLFTFIVNRITHISLQKINMIEALKSVE